MAEKLEIGERTYKFYELGHREISAGTAVRFCEMFKLDLNWLLRGEAIEISDAALNLSGEVFKAVLELDAETKSMLSLDKLSNIHRLALSDATQNPKANPKKIATKYFEILK